MNRRAIALLSGGLDSTLAVKMMVEQEIEVHAVNFTSPFCNCSPRRAGCKHHARRIAEEFGIPIHVISKGIEYMRIVQNAPHGYGRGMNPCIDCRIYMLRKVKEMMPRLEASFVITGEVLGQRPMSQHRHTLRLIEKESGLDGFVLRPLSAHHFDPTVPELAGIVDRGKLLSMSGRSRKPQIALAQGLGIKDYPCPAGGCLLTDSEIASRLSDLFAHVPDYDMTDLYLLKVGRHFRLNPSLKVILGRNQNENETIARLAKDSSILFTPSGFRGPTAVIRGSLDKISETTISGMIAGYSQDRQQEYAIEKQVIGGGNELLFITDRFPAEQSGRFLIRGKKKSQKHRKAALTHDQRR